MPIALPEQIDAALVHVLSKVLGRSPDDELVALVGPEGWIDAEDDEEEVDQNEDDDDDDDEENDDEEDEDEDE